MSARAQLRWLLACAVGLLVLGLLAGVRPEGALYVAVALSGPLTAVFVLGAHGGVTPNDRHSRRGLRP